MINFSRVILCYPCIRVNALLPVLTCLLPRGIVLGLSCELHWAAIAPVSEKRNTQGPLS